MPKTKKAPAPPAPAAVMPQRQRALRVDGLVFDSTTGGDPQFYKAKQRLEKRLGRPLSTEEFLRDHYKGTASRVNSGTSVFDPVLAELLVRWFSPPGGLVLDPFAGGSCRGVVSAALGREYWGVDLAARQLAANAEQAAFIFREAPPAHAPRWIHGDSRELDKHLPADLAADFILSCPPYYDLEQYSEDPRDLSAMEFAGFCDAYRAVIAAAMARLKPDRFAAFVVGDVRDQAGIYRGLPAVTVAAFAAAGAGLYNEAVLITPIGSLPVRCVQHFRQHRKLARAHQAVLVFVKGDPRAATIACGEAEFGAGGDPLAGEVAL